MVWGIVSAKETPKKTNEEKALFQKRTNILFYNEKSYQNEHKSNNLKSLLMNINFIISSGMQYLNDLTSYLMNTSRWKAVNRLCGNCFSYYRKNLHRF